MDLHEHFGHKFEAWPKVRGKAAPYVEFKGKLADRYKGLAAIREDLHRAFRGLFAMTKEHENVVAESLWESAITTYARCFTESEGRRTVLDAKQNLKSLSDELKKAHEYFMAIRHTYIAHAGLNDLENTVVYIALNPEPEKRGVYGPGVAGARLSLPSKDTYESFCKLVMAVHAIVEQLLNDATKRIAMECHVRSIDELYAEATNPPADIVALEKPYDDSTQQMIVGTVPTQ